MYNLYFGHDDYNFTKSVTFYIIVINVAVWILQLVTYPLIDNVFALTPSEALTGSYWQFITYMFLHATYTRLGGIYPLHIFFNMFIFLIFGSVVERVLKNPRKFIFLYLASGVGSAMVYMVFTGVSNIGLLGASGAVFGVLAAYAFKFPKQWVYLMGIFPMPAAVLIAFLLIEEMFLGLLSLQPGIANFGHVGGIISGLLIMFYLKQTEKKGRRFRDFEFIWE